MEKHDDRSIDVGGFSLGDVRLLTPETTTVFEVAFSTLHCAIKDTAVYRGVFAMRMFPILRPDEFISLSYTDSDDKEHEIGVIEDLQTFPEEQQRLIYRSLTSYYHEQVISRVFRIRNDYGLLFFEVGTKYGREKFIMRWQDDCAQDYGENGKVLLDAFDNRWIIRDVETLPSADQRCFAKYIYW